MLASYCALRQRNHAILRRLKTMRAHRECILQPMRHQNRRSPIHISLLDNQLDNRCRRHRIESACRRIVEQIDPEY